MRECATTNFKVNFLRLVIRDRPGWDHDAYTCRAGIRKGRREMNKSIVICKSIEWNIMKVHQQFMQKDICNP